MSDELEKLERQLEDATATGKSLDATLDAETKSLREGWLALGELIEAAESTVDGASSAGPPPLQYPAQVMLRKEHKSAAWKTAAALAALSASLLVAALVGWSLVGQRDGEKIAQDQKPHQQDKTQSPAPIENATAPTENTTAPVLVEDEQGKSDPVADEFDWDAPLDNEIASAGQKMLSIRADWYASDDTAGALYYRMQQMQQDLNDNTL